MKKWITISSAISMVMMVMTACHHAPPKVETPSAVEVKATPTASDAGNPMAAPAPSQERILSSYSLLQLDAAANAYKVTADEMQSKPADTPPAAIFGCPVKVETAKGAATPLQVLLESKRTRDEQSYVRAPAVYLRTRDASNCEKTCACAVILDVLSGIDVLVLKKADQDRHEELLVELQSKSAKQGPDAVMECAKKQTWLCGSDLERYVKAHLSQEK